jgi:hypothetical protein
MTTRALPALPTTDAEAIAFALDHLDHGLESTDFLRDWRERRALTTCRAGIERDRTLAAEIAAG